MIRPLLLLAVAVVLSAGDAAPLRVVSTTTILADIATQVGGARIDSRCLIRPGVDGHTYQPTPDDVI